jgi:hypothetical protein
VCPDEAGIGADPAIRASFASVAKRVSPATSPTILRDDQHIAAALGE